MAGPAALVTRLGRTIYKGANGRFISKADYDRQVGVDSYLTAQLGAAPSGNSWVQIAAKYHERFADYLEGAEL